MINPQTKAQLQQLKLPAFITAFEEIIQNASQTLSLGDALGFMAERELLLRENKRLERLLKAAKLRYPSACVAQVDYGSTRQFQSELFRELTHCAWVKAARNIIFTGATGTGKSYLACALGHQSCQMGYKTRYLRVNRLTEQLRLSHADGSYGKYLEQLAKVQVLILDDWGIDQLERQARRDLLEVLEDRYGRTATMITSQLPIECWHRFIGDDTIADAVCDRIVSNSYSIDVKGDSMRKQKNSS